jgi:hypothetical protein
MDTDTNLNNTSSNNTGTTTDNPQSATQDTSLSGGADNPQYFGSTSINNSPGSAIPLEPTQFTTASIQNIKVNHHHVNLAPLIPVGVLFILALGVAIYIHFDSKKALVKT